MRLSGFLKHERKRERERERERERKSERERGREGGREGEGGRGRELSGGEAMGCCKALLGPARSASALQISV